MKFSYCDIFFNDYNIHHKNGYREEYLSAAQIYDFQSSCTLFVKLISNECHTTSLIRSHIGSLNGLVPSGNKPLPEPMLTQISVAPLGHSELILTCCFQKLSFNLQVKGLCESAEQVVGSRPQRRVGATQVQQCLGKECRVEARNQNGCLLADDIFNVVAIVVFWFKFHCSLFPRVQLTISQHWFR